jgi:hypothetical protein
VTARRSAGRDRRRKEEGNMGEREEHEQHEVLNHSVEVKLTSEQMNNRTVTQLAAKYGGVVMTNGTIQFPNRSQAETFRTVAWDWTGAETELSPSATDE